MKTTMVCLATPILAIASAFAGVYGRKYVQTEMFSAGDRSAGWTSYPGDHKLQGDAVYCSGVNRFVFHSYAHQPSHLEFDPAPPLGRRVNGIDVGHFVDALSFDGGELTLPTDVRRHSGGASRAL